MYKLFQSKKQPTKPVQKDWFFFQEKLVLFQVGPRLERENKNLADEIKGRKSTFLFATMARPIPPTWGGIPVYSEGLTTLASGETHKGHKTRFLDL